jgi:CubicO group peptidase (beta-lactamase class C family)
VAGNKAHWCHSDLRRRGWHKLHEIARYGVTFRARRVMTLQKQMDSRIAELESVRLYTSLPWFSAMVLVEGQRVLFERYAPDFGPDSPHSIQSITKTTTNLIIGQLIESGVLAVNDLIKRHIPEIGSGYAEATLQQVLNMDVVNEYSEDFSDPASTYYRHEEAIGWRLPSDSDHEPTQRDFIARIASSDVTNRTGIAQYKDANPEVAGWVAERTSGKSLNAFLADIVDAAGIAGTWHMTTDRAGTPSLAGGACLTARDLARYFSIFVRRGRGVNGETVGSEAFIEQTLQSGVPRSPPYDWGRYSNSFMVFGRTLGHAGWGGQCALANLDTGKVGVFLSVVENEHATTANYLGPIVRMLADITSMDA